MVNRSKVSSDRAFKEACKKNGLNYDQYDKGVKSDYVKLKDEDGNSFHLNNDLSVDSCTYRNKNNDLAATCEKKRLKNKVESMSKKKSDYKIQKGLQKA